MSSHRRGREAAVEPVLRWGGRLVPELPAFSESPASSIPARAARRAAFAGLAGPTAPAGPAALTEGVRPA